MKYIWNLLLCMAVCSCGSCDKNENKGKDVVSGPGYLFAHMSTTDYGSMYYSVSSDGIEWETLNNGEKINDYRGHHDFCMGRDGRYYMIGIDGSTRKPLLWVTSNLISWGVEKHLPESMFDVEPNGYFTEKVWYCAPKMFFDEASDQYIITWHPAELKYKDRNLSESEREDMWRSIRTFYVLTKDFVTFTEPERLFSFTGIHESMPTMDAIIRKVNGRYYTFIKDERWPTEITEGAKAIRWCVSDNLTGPYSNPSYSVTETWTEAQTIVRTPDGEGWRLYVEHYPIEYHMYESPGIEGPWTKIKIKSPDSRHGSMIWVDAETLTAVRRAYRNK